MAAAAAIMADQTLESRVARLESDVSHIRSDIAEMKLDIREIRKELAELNQRLIRGLASNRIWTLLQSVALLGVMARGFKWL
jgi:phage shock protein A